MFEDRTDAGKRLAKALENYKGKGALVLAIPRGGVEVGYQVADYLDADFSIIVARKLTFPDNPEAGFGAVAEDGSAFIFDEAKTWLPEELINLIKEEQTREIARRVEVLRDKEPLPETKGRTVILVDDGIAMGSTMRAAARCCRKKKAGKVIVAAPVSGIEVARQIQKEADEVVILEKPLFFRAVAEVYMNWYDVPDNEVIAILRKWRENKKIKRR